MQCYTDNTHTKEHNMKFVTDLNKAVVVEKSGLAALKSVEMAAALADIYSRGKPVMVVDSVQQFFSVTHLFDVLNDPTRADVLPVLLEKRGIELNDADQQTLADFHKFKTRLLDSITVGKDAYPFAELPDDWKLSEKILFQSKTVRRKGDYNGYTIGYTALRKIWDEASKYWAGIQKRPSDFYTRAGSYNRSTEIGKDKVTIGCQEIQRYELEQAALHLGWEFPVETI
jgi:hypothetical protein